MNVKVFKKCSEKSYVNYNPEVTSINILAYINLNYFSIYENNLYTTTYYRIKCF